MRLSTNVAAMNVNRRLADVNGDRFRTLEKLSSGDRIVRSADDAAGLAISEKLKAGVRSLQVAARNSNDGISVIQTAEGGINEVQNILVRLRELATQAASDTIGGEERAYVNQEFGLLKDEITRIADTTTFNGQPLLNGHGQRLEFQVGVDSSERDDRLVFDAGQSNITAGALGIGGIHVSSKQSAGEVLAKIDKASDQVSNHRSALGALQSALYSNMQNVNIHRENAAHANSRIRDADMGYWTARQAQQDIISQAGTAVQAQANTMPQQAVRLLDQA